MANKELNPAYSYSMIETNFDAGNWIFNSIFAFW